MSRNEKKQSPKTALKLLTFPFFVILSYILPWGAKAVDDYGLDDTKDNAFGGDSPPFKGQDPPAILGSVIGAALSFIGILFFVLMIYGGITWMTAAGNQQQIDKAKNLIISAIIGLIIVMAAYAITSFIGTTLT